MKNSHMIQDDIYPGSVDGVFRCPGKKEFDIIVAINVKYYYLGSL